MVTLKLRLFVSSADILESFDTHHPLVLPDEGYQFLMGRQVTDASLREELDKLKEYIAVFPELPSDKVAATKEAKLAAIEVFPKAGLRTVDRLPAETNLSTGAVCDWSPSTTSGALPPLPSPPSSPSSTQNPDQFTSCSDLELEGRKAGDANRSARDPSCLLTPPNNAHLIDPVEKWMKGDGETLPWSSSVNAHNEGGLVFECLAALEVDRSKLDSPSITRFVYLKEEEGEEMEEAEGDHDDDTNDEVFSLELERGEQGIGLALVDTRDSSTRAKGVFVRAVVPDSPAARCARLVPGDRILASNGVSLLGLDFLSGEELIQSSGDRLRLLVDGRRYLNRLLPASVYQDCQCTMSAIKDDFKSLFNLQAQDMDM
ncbi:uncharacterized protein ACO6RY_16122 [Pungitius sinensis]